jgi:hypothetical protein
MLPIDRLAQLAKKEGLVFASPECLRRLAYCDTVVINENIQFSEDLSRDLEASQIRRITPDRLSEDNKVDGDDAKQSKNRQYTLGTVLSGSGSHIPSLNEFDFTAVVEPGDGDSQQLSNGEIETTTVEILTKWKRASQHAHNVVMQNLTLCLLYQAMFAAYALGMLTFMSTSRLTPKEAAASGIACIVAVIANSMRVKSPQAK